MHRGVTFLSWLLALWQCAAHLDPSTTFVKMVQCEGKKGILRWNCRPGLAHKVVLIVNDKQVGFPETMEECQTLLRSNADKPECKATIVTLTTTVKTTAAATTTIPPMTSATTTAQGTTAEPAPARVADGTQASATTVTALATTYKPTQLPQSHINATRHHGAAHAHGGSGAGHIPCKHQNKTSKSKSGLTSHGEKKGDDGDDDDDDDDDEDDEEDEDEEDSPTGSGLMWLFVLLGALSLTALAGYLAFKWLTIPRKTPAPLLADTELGEGDPVNRMSSGTDSALWMGSDGQARQLMPAQQGVAGFTQF